MHLTQIAKDNTSTSAGSTLFSDAERIRHRTHALNSSGKTGSDEPVPVFPLP